MTTTVPVKNTRDEMISHSPVKLVDEIITRAYSEKASDIHIEPGEYGCVVRIRVDGSLIYIGRYKKEIHEETIARLKVLSSLRTDVRLAPQDGRFRITISGQPVNVRVSLVPTFWGEKCVLRLLPLTLHTQTVETLGFSEHDTQKISNVLASSHGMILVVGPTGSGKTTTLYTLLQKICTPEISVATLEDPIEYSVAGIAQIPIHTGSTMTFSSALRAVVRQDPDVIMVGEIRDTATAELATHAALTGHVVLSTLHTNDAVTALLRLVDMGVEAFLVASTVRAVVSQRLVRKICQKCKKRQQASQSEIEYLRKIGHETNGEAFVSRGAGCKSCRNTGYTGRTVIAEVLIPDDSIKQLIMQKASAPELLRVAFASGMRSILHDAADKIVSGVTTCEEVVSACHS